jgi:aminopeptidase-like protein
LDGLSVQGSVPLGSLRAELDREAEGRAMHALAAELYPICRSITGAGMRQTLDVLGRQLPLERHRIASGTRVFDWTVPPEWNIREAWIRGPHGEKVVDFARHNLHVVSYSEPVRARMPLAELRAHLHTLPDRPRWIPYRTSYYQRTWGFCLEHEQAARLADGEYEVCIDASLEDGHLDWAELVLPGESAEEVLVSCHACHPSLANDNLSSLAVATSLARLLARARRRFTYRFLFIPGTIGAIAWLAKNEARARAIRHGMVLACLGDPGPFTWKRSRAGDREIDRIALHVLRTSGRKWEARPFTPYGYDERQYGSPGFDLSVGRLTRTPNGEYPEYHTSADDLTLIRPEALADSLDMLLRILEVAEGDRVYVNTQPMGEPQLGRRGLYGALGGLPDPGARSLAMLWVLNQSDGRHSLLDIAARAELPFELVRETAELLEAHQLLRVADPRNPAC